MAALEEAQARVDVAYARLAPEQRSDKMLGVAQRFVDAARVAAERAGRLALQATALAGGLSGVAQGAARGDLLGIASGALQTISAVAGRLADTGGSRSRWRRWRARCRAAPGGRA